MDTLSRLGMQIADIERERDRRRLAANPPPPGVAPVPRGRYIVVPVDGFNRPDWSRPVIEHLPEPHGKKVKK